MQPVNFKDLLISHCEVAKIPYTIKDNELSISMDSAINQGKLTQLCDSWYSNHNNNCMVFTFNTGLVYSLTRAEYDAYREIIRGMPEALVKAQYGVMKIDTRKIEEGRSCHITFASPEDALNMSFQLINNELDYDNEKA